MIRRFFIIISIVFPEIVSGQSLIGFSGSNSQNINSSVGEVTIGLAYDNNHILSIGFQQPLLLLTEVEEAVSLEISVSPNPVISNLEIKHSIDESITLILRNSNGSPIKFIENVGHNHIINLADLPNGNYLIEFLTHNSKSYSLIKIN